MATPTNPWSIKLKASISMMPRSSGSLYASSMADATAEDEGEKMSAEQPRTKKTENAQGIKVAGS